jgi:hypothetical protein
VTQAIHRLDDDRADRDEQQPRVRDRGKNGEAPQAIGAARCRAAAREHGAGPREHEPEHVAQVVPGIGDQGEGVRAEPEHNLGDDERDVERDADGECTIEARGRV